MKYNNGDGDMNLIKKKLSCKRESWCIADTMKRLQYYLLISNYFSFILIFYFLIGILATHE